MPYTIQYTTRFTALHAIPGIVDEVHPHDWVLEAHFKVTTIAENGIGLNYFEIKKTIESILPQSGNSLNTLLPVIPTAENLSKYYYDVLKPLFPALQTVAVGEFPEFMCYYQP